MKRNNWVWMSSMLAISGAATALWAMPAAAAETDAKPAAEAAVVDSGDIVVTARKREERLQDVPVAVSAIGGEALQQGGITQVADIPQRVPGLTMVPSAFGANTLQVAIRGQRQYDPYITKDPAVGVYFADVIQNRPQGLNAGLFDLESVQVLKGPQGTLFGRNTTGGAMLIAPVRPKDEFEGYITAGFGNYNARRLEGALNVPLTDRLAARFAGSLVRRDGYVTSVTSGQKLNDQHKDSYRFSVRWEPTDYFENRTVVAWFEAKENGTAYKLLDVNDTVFNAVVTGSNLSPNVAVRPSTRGVTLAALKADLARTKTLDFFETTSDLLHRTNIKTFSASNVTEIDLGDAQLKNVFGYRRVVSFINFDLDGSALNVFPSLENMQERQFSNELQIQGTTLKGALDYIVGAFYFRENGSDYQRSDAIGGDRESFADPIVNSAYSFFGQATYRLPFLEGVSLTAGARQNYDTRSLTARSKTNGVCRLTTLDVGGVPLNPCEKPLTQDYKKLTYTASIDWKITPDTMVYVAHRKGFRTGGFNFSGGAPSTLVPFNPEEVKDYEAGLKTKFDLGGMRTRFNLAVYHQKYESIQRSIGFFLPAGSNNFVNGITNAATAKIDGVEADLLLQPIPELDLNANISYINAKYSGFFDFSSSGARIDVSPSAFAGAPKVAISAGAAYTAALPGEAGDVVVRGDLYYQAKTNWSDSNYNPTTGIVDPLTYTKAYTMVNGRVEWRDVMGQPISVAVYGKNLTDVEYIASGTWLYRSFGFTAGYAGEPRTYGIEATYRF